MLDAAEELMYAGGVRAVGMDDIRDRSGVSLRALYGLFPTKHDLVVAWLEDRHHRWAQWFSGQTRTAPAVIDERVRAGFTALTSWAGSPDFHGCAFVRAVAEHGDDARVRAVALKHKDWLRGFFLEELANCGREPDPRLALQLAVLVDGGLVQAAFGAGPAATRAAGDLALLALAQTRSEYDD